MRLNGNLVLNSDATGEIQHAYIERLSVAPTFNAAQKGRLYFNTNTALYYFNDGSAWVPFATGGNAASLQTEVDAIESSLGSVVNSNGTFNGASAFAGSPFISAATSITEALTLLAEQAAGTDTLAELGDVQFGTLVNGQYLKYNSTSGKWENDTLTLADVTDVTATAVEVNLLNGATFSTTELNYITGVTSPIQTQLNNKQPLDAGLTALAAFNTNGILVQTADDVFAGRTLQSPAEGIVITNPDGVAGNPSVGLANDLQAVEGLTGAGYAIRTGTDTWTTRSITGQAGKVVVTNGDGVASNTDIDLALVTDTNTGTFLKFTRDAYGRVQGTTAVVEADIASLVDGRYINVSGDSLDAGASLVFSGGGTVTGLPAPTSDMDAANKAYVDAVSAGLSWKNAVLAATVGNIVLSGTQTIDDVFLPVGSRVLVKDQTVPAQNGIYVVATGSWIRDTSMDAAVEFDGAAVFVKEGTVNADSGWVQTATVTLVDSNPVNFSQFSGAATYTWGVGLAATGNTINVNLGAGIAQLPSDEVGIDLYDSTAGAIILTDNGVSRAALPASNSKLHLLLDTTLTGGLAQGTLGLYIKANGITNDMVMNDSHGLNADSGTGSLALGDTLLIQGNSVQGIVTSVTGGTFTINATDASTSAKGVARFDQFDFDVASGIVSIKLGGVDNDQLANSSVIVTGTTGSDAVALGESFAIIGGLTGEVSTVMGANSLAISVRDATTSLKGVASFNTDDFTVVDGAVSSVAKNLDSLTDVTVVNPVGGQTLIKTGDGTGDFVNRSIYFLYTSNGASTVHTVSHNLGQKYCNVTVVDNDDEVIIPQSIHFDTAGQLTVTFTSAIDCRVIAMGVNPDPLA